MGDLQCDGLFDAVDALAVDRVLASLTPIPVPTDCPEIGDTVTLEQSAATYTPMPTPAAFVPVGRELNILVLSEESTPALGAFNVRIRHNQEVSLISRVDCTDGVQCDFFRVGDMHAAGAQALGFASGPLFSFTIQVNADTRLELDPLVVADTEGNLIDSTLTLSPSDARFYVRGDADCNGDVSQGYDLMPFLERFAGSDVADCADRAEPGSGISHPQDTDCDNVISVTDFLVLLRYFADVAVDVPDCDPIGT